MPRLTKIYTRTGDAGVTGLGDGARALKNEPRVEAMGEVDEANAAIGLSICRCDDSTHGSAIRSVLLAVQQDLFDVGADLCVPLLADEKPGERLRISADQTKRLEALIDDHNAALKPLESFILPGGSELSARLHLARAIVRRAERRVVTLKTADPKATNADTIVYLNRLSDLLFVLARIANIDHSGDVLWVPGANRSADPPEPASPPDQSSA